MGGFVTWLAYDRAPRGDRTIPERLGAVRVAVEPGDPADPADPAGTADPVVIDGGDRSCVRLLLELRPRLAELPAGTIVHLMAGDPAAPLDLAAWCHMTGHGYLGTVPPPYGTTPTYALRVAAAPRPTQAESPWRPQD